MKEADVSVPVCHPRLEEEGGTDGEVGWQVFQIQGCLGLPVGYRDIGTTRGIGELQYLLQLRIIVDKGVSTLGGK